MYKSPKTALSILALVVGITTFLPAFSNQPQYSSQMQSRTIQNAGGDLAADERPNLYDRSAQSNRNDSKAGGYRSSYYYQDKYFHNNSDPSYNPDAYFSQPAQAPTYNTTNNYNSQGQGQPGYPYQGYYNQGQ